MDFMILGTFDEAPGTVQSPGVRADAQCPRLRAGNPTPPSGLATLLVSFKRRFSVYVLMTRMPAVFRIKF